jgi:hypothetical protein
MRVRSTLVLVPAALAGLGLASTDRPAHAQSLTEPPRARQGYYVALGLLGSVDYNRDHGDGLGVWGGGGLSLRFGQLITRRLGLGLSIDYGNARQGSERAELGAFGIEAQWELLRNVAVRGGVGLGVANLTDTADADAKPRGTVGAGYTLGLSYDWFPGGRVRSGGFAVTPLAKVRLVPGGAVTAVLGMVGFELAWWSGLPSNQLDLQAAEAYRGR